MHIAFLNQQSKLKLYQLLIVKMPLCELMWIDMFQLLWVICCIHVIKILFPAFTVPFQEPQLLLFPPKTLGKHPHPKLHLSNENPDEKLKGKKTRSVEVFERLSPNLYSRDACKQWQLSFTFY